MRLDKKGMNVRMMAFLGVGILSLGYLPLAVSMQAMFGLLKLLYMAIRVCQDPTTE